MVAMVAVVLVAVTGERWHGMVGCHVCGVDDSQSGCGCGAHDGGCHGALQPRRSGRGRDSLPTSPLVTRAEQWRNRCPTTATTLSTSRCCWLAWASSCRTTASSPTWTTCTTSSQVGPTVTLCHHRLPGALSTGLHLPGTCRQDRARGSHFIQILAQL